MNVEEGQTVEEWAPVTTVRSDKATVEITSRYTGVVKKVHYAVGDEAKTGSALIDIEVADGVADDVPAVSNNDDAPSAPSPPPPAPAAASAPAPAPVAAAPVASTPAPVPQAPAGRKKSLASPAVRRIAMQHKVNINDVHGTGRDGMVLKGDILAFIEGGKVVAAPAPVSSSALVGSGASIAQDRTIDIKGFAKVMVKTMTAATAVPHFGYCDEIDMTALVALRGSLKDQAEAAGVKLSYMPFMLKAASIALTKYPVLNSSVSADATQLTYKGAHNIGIAMDTKDGLVVPNVKNVQNLSIVEIAAELNRLQKDGAAGRLSSSDLSGGTFTLSNIGSIGGTYASPVLVLPEVCIGAVSKIQRVPRFGENDEVIATSIMRVSWSADHRVIDGATMARFSNVWKDALENPGSMLLHLR